MTTPASSGNASAGMINSLLERAGATLECAAVTMFAIPGATFDLGKLQSVEATCKKLRTTHGLHSDLSKDLGDAAVTSRPPPRMELNAEMLALTEAVESLRSSVDGELQKWRLETGPTRRVDVHDDRRRITTSKVAALEGLVRDALKEGAAQLAALCEAALADKSLSPTDDGATSPADGEGFSEGDEAMAPSDDAQFRSPIDARDESGALPFPRLSSSDVATAAQPLAEWLLRTLPSMAKSACGVVYRVADLAHMLLKAAVVMQSSAAAGEMDAGLMAMATAIVTDLSGSTSIGAPVEDVRCCLIQAFVALFAYTVNLDGHYGDPAVKGGAPLDTATTMRLLAEVEWKRQQTPETARGGMLKKPAESDAAFMASTTAAPGDKDAFGYNAAPWAVMNWTLRVRADPAAAKAVREKADRGARAYHALAQHIEWALGLLPATHATVYRGIRGRTTRPYVQGTAVVWPAFSSTSTDGQEALKFMGKDRGTYFIVHSVTARDVAFASWYPLQAERLLPPGRQFCVQSRVSDTVLAMLESNVELIVMREATEDVGGDAEDTGSGRFVAASLDDDAAAGLAVEAVARTTFVFKDFVARYVEGRLTSVRGSEAAEHVTSVGEVAGEIARGYGDGDGEGSGGAVRPKKICFVGGSGTGKTSAMLYVLSELARCGSDGSADGQPGVVPVFVSLPALRLWDGEKQEAAGAPVDAYVLAALGLQTASQVAALAKRSRLVVLLDSLDEVEERLRVHLRGALRKAANPLVAEHAAHVIVSTRPEAAGDAELLLGDGLRMLYCLPFTPADARTLLARKVAQRQHRQHRQQEDVAKTAESPGKSPDTASPPPAGEDALWAQLESWRAVPQLSNPFVATMCIETLLVGSHHLEAAHVALCDPSWQPMCDVDIYEAYLRWKLAAATPEGSSSSSSSLAGYPRLAVATELALTMTSEGRSHSTVEALGTRIEACRNVLRMEALVADAGVSFRHKSLQEYLVARAIAGELLQQANGVAPSLSLLASLPSLTLMFPEVSGLLASLIMRNPAHFERALGSLRDVVTTAGSSPQAVGSALAMLARTGYPLERVFSHDDLEGRSASDADLNSIKFGALSLRNAELRNCFLAASQWKGTDVTSLTVKGCTFAEYPACKSHTMGVTSVAFSPCGTKLASGSDDNTVKVHDAATGRELSSFTGHSAALTSVAYSPCGTKLASGSFDKTVKVHDVATGRELSSFAGHADVVRSVAYSPCGTKLASGTDDKTARVHDVATGRELSSFTGHTATVTSVAFSPCGTKLASGSDDKTVKVHDVATGRELSSFTGHTDGIKSVAFSPCGTKLASGSKDKTVKVLDVATGRELSSFAGHTAGAWSVVFSPCGTKLASGSFDKTVKVHDVATGRELSSFAGHTAAVRSVMFSPCGMKLASGSTDKTVKLHDVATGRELSSFAGHTDSVTPVAFSPCGRKLASGSLDKTVKVHDVATGRELSSFAGHTDGVRSVAFSPCGAKLASGSSDKTARVHDVATGRELWSFTGHTDVVWFVAYSPCGTKVVSGSDDKTVKVHDVATGRELSSFAGHAAGIKSVAFSPCGTKLASGSDDKTVKVHDVATGRELSLFASHTAGVTAVMFSPCGTKLASGSTDKTVKVHDVAKGDLLSSFTGHSASVRSVAFSPCGMKLATGSFDKTVKVHEVATGRELWSFTGHTAAVAFVAYSPCGTKLASGSADKTVKVLDGGGAGVRVFLDISKFVSSVHETAGKLSDGSDTVARSLLSRDR